MTAATALRRTTTDRRDTRARLVDLAWTELHHGAATPDTRRAMEALTTHLPLMVREVQWYGLKHALSRLVPQCGVRLSWDEAGTDWAARVDAHLNALTGTTEVKP